MFRQAYDTHGKEQWAGGAIVRAGLAVFPYLARLKMWSQASMMLGHAIVRDDSPATLATVLPRVRRIAEATAGTEGAHIYLFEQARVLRKVGLVTEADKVLRNVAKIAEGRKDFAAASSAASELAQLLSSRGHSTQSLEVLRQQAKFTRRARHGPWSQLHNEVQILQVRCAMGEHQEVLDRGTDLRVLMKTSAGPTRS